MRILRILLSVLVLLIIVFFAGGFFIPDEWEVSRSVTINASPKHIYPLISNFKKWKEWSPWNATQDPSLKYNYEGPESGVGAKQSWTSEKMGQGWMKLTKADPQQGVAYDLYIDMNGHASTLQGEISFTQEDKNTKLTWTDQGNSNKSLVNRWMSLLLKPMLGKDLDKGLNNIKAFAESESRP